MSTVLINDEYLTDIADAIRDKNGEDTTYTPSEMATAIASISTTATTVEATADTGVQFVDYDGTVLYFYTWEEIATLTELPELPTWTAEWDNGTVSMTCNSWNWTLADLQSFGRDELLIVGAVYIPTDGNTHLIVDLNGYGEASLYLEKTTTAGTLTIDWGDGETSEYTDDLSDAELITHTYTTTSTVVEITISAEDCGYTLYGDTYYNCVGISSNRYDAYGVRLLSAYIGGSCDIGGYAFRQASSLKNVTLPADITSIGTFCFQRCVALEYITIPYGATSFGTYAFSSCYTLAAISLPPTMCDMENAVFYYCYSLVNVVLPNDVITLGTRTFSDCYSLSEITFPASLNTAESYTCANCYQLKSVSILGSLSQISSSFCYRCYALKSITLPDSVTYIVGSAFYYCESLTELQLPDDIETIEAYALRYIHVLEELELPSALVTLGNYNINDMWNLKSLTLPDTLESIGTYCFYNCYSLNEITIPESVTSIGANSFNYCNFKTIDGLYVPSGVSTLYRYCYELENLTNVRSIEYALTVSASTKLTVDSLNNLIAALADLSDTGGYTLTIGATNLAKLTDDEIAVATGKGWTVA